MITEKKLLETLERLFEIDDLEEVEPLHRRVMAWLDEAAAQHLLSCRRAAQLKEQVNKHLQTLWVKKHDEVYNQKAP